jgi:hypothetical protein
MTKLAGRQLSLIAELEDDDCPISDWGYEKLGTNISLVPNSGLEKLGTNISLVPNFYEPPQHIPRWDDPIDPTWKPPLGCLDLKWIKNHQYYCWRYYDIAGKKRSIHLHKDYNKAVRKAMRIGVPTDAKPVKSTDLKTQTPTQSHRLDLAPTASGTSRSARAA